jgi:hypothetical protein
LQKPLGEPKGNLEDNIKMNLRKIGCENERWVDRVMIVSNGELRHWKYWTFGVSYHWLMTSASPVNCSKAKAKLALFISN